MDRENNIIVKISDKEVGFRIDNWVLLQAQKKTGSKGLVELFVKVGVDDGALDLEAFSILVMEAYNEYKYVNKQTDLIDERGACNLIDEMGGIINALSLLSEGLITYVPKNSQPPQKVGEMISQ